MAISVFEVEEGFSIEGEVNWIKGTVDPSAGGGVAAPIGSTYSRTTNGEQYSKTGGADTDWTLTSATNDDVHQNNFMGKTGTGVEYPEYSSSNVVTSDSTGTAGDGDNLEEAVGALDAEIGAAVTPEARTYNPTSDQAINLNIDQLDSAIGTDAEHASTDHTTVNASLKTNISELDAALSGAIFTKTGTNVDADPAITIDDLAVATYCMAEWHICVWENATPANRESFKMTALNDGTITNIDSNLYAKNKTGTGVAGLAMDVIGSGGNMSLQMFATNNIDYSLYRFRG